LFITKEKEIRGTKWTYGTVRIEEQKKEKLEMREMNVYVVF
jgi:hypothetical protein